jgi:hypothetical protein
MLPGCTGSYVKRLELQFGEERIMRWQRDTEDLHYQGTTGARLYHPDEKVGGNKGIASKKHGRGSA